MTLLHGVDRNTSGGAVAGTAPGTIVYNSGIPMNALGEVMTTAITGAPPAGSIIKGGASYAVDGSIQTTTDAIGIVDKGIAYTLARVLCITTNAPDNSSRYAYLPHIGMVLVDSTGRVHVS